MSLRNETPTLGGLHLSSQGARQQPAHRMGRVDDVQFSSLPRRREGDDADESQGGLLQPRLISFPACQAHPASRAHTFPCTRATRAGKGKDSAAPSPGGRGLCTMKSWVGAAGGVGHCLLTRPCRLPELRGPTPSSNTGFNHT